MITASALQVRVSDLEEDAVIEKSMDALVWLRKQLEEPDPICCGRWPQFC